MNILSRSLVDVVAFSRHWLWFFIWGLALIVIGALAISYSTYSTLLSVVVLGFIIFAASIVILIDTFTFWWKRWRGFFLHLLMGLLYLAVGVILINNPVWASVSLTLFLAVFYIVAGIFRIFYYLSVNQPKSGWNLFSGIIALLLGVLILSQWPASSLFFIGLFVGIDLLFLGWAYVMASLAAKNLISRV